MEKFNAQQVPDEAARGESGLSRPGSARRVRSVCVFCGARTGDSPAFAAAAEELGRLVAERNLTLVYGGGRVGLMGHVADAVVAAGGRARGIIPDFLQRREVAHAAVDLEVVSSMHVRKQRMFDLSDAFLVLPGGVGTLDETMEIITWAQLGHHDKPVVIIDVDGYWRPLRSLLDHVVARNFAEPSLMDLYAIVGTPEAALDLAMSDPARRPGSSAGL